MNEDIMHFSSSIAILEKIQLDVDGAIRVY